MPKVSQAHIANMQEHILKVAMQCFAQNGFHATGMAQIIETSGLSAGGVYRYYASKEALIIAIIDRQIQQISTLIEPSTSLNTPLALTRYYLESIEKLKNNPDNADFEKIIPQIWAETMRNPTIMHMVKQNYELIIDLFTRHLTQCQSSATKATRNEQIPQPNSRVLAQVIWGVVHGYVLQCLLFEEIDMQAYLQTIAGVVQPNFLTQPS